MTFKEFLLEEEKKKKKKAEKEIADFENERTHKSYRASNALNARGQGRGIK